MIKWNRKALEKHLDIVLKYDFDDIPINYVEGYVKKIPTKLYKYRNFQNMHLKAIEDDYIWLSLAKDFTDKSDSTINFDFNKQDKKIRDTLNELMPKLVIGEIRKVYIKQGIAIPLNFKKGSLEETMAWIKEHTYKSGTFKYGKVRRYLKSKKLAKSKINKLEARIKELTSEESKNKIAQNIIKGIADINNKYREMFFVHSFSAEKDNPFLWDVYTSKDKGFCIEYDLIEYNELISLFPILYGKLDEIRMDDFIKIGFKNYIGKQNNLKNHDFAIKVFSHLLTKDKRYETENEWRLIINRSKQESNEFHFPFVTAIYLGSKMNENNKKRLIGIAKRKGIKVYQRQRNKLNTGYEFTKIL